ncbi:MAG: hypothetical protein ABFD82_02305 [Syntrophaceae bacterium]
MTDQGLPAASSDLIRLCGFLEQKIAIFKEFMSASAFLKDMIKQGNVEAIEISIAQRDDYRTLIGNVDDEIHRIKEANPSYEVPEIQKHIQPRLKTLENLIGKTLRLHQDCEAAAQDALDTLRNDLSGLNHSQKGFKGYREKSGEPRFLDVKT